MRKSFVLTIVSLGALILIAAFAIRVSRPHRAAAEASIFQPESSAAPAFDVTQLPVLLKLTLGISDSQPTTWDGVAHLDRGQFLEIQGWIFTRPEGVDGRTISWRVESKGANYDTRNEIAGEPPLGGRQRPPFPRPRPVGVWLRLQAAPDDVLGVKTAEGDFEVSLQDIPQEGAISFLNGRVQLERGLPSLSISRTEVHEDYPSLAAGPEGRFLASWIGYQGGVDSVYYSLLEGDGWSPSQRLTPEGVYGSTATVFDGQGRGWIVYNRMDSGQFDLWTRQVYPEPGREIRLSRDPGNDFNHQAQTGPDGAIWLVWQGLREGQSDVFSIRAVDLASPPQPIPVSHHPSDDWNPAVAIDSKGQAAIVWDTYRNGDFDVYLRTLNASGTLGEVEIVSATSRYEANASAAFDREDRLWVAWEESGPNWGKDTGQESTQLGTMLHSFRELQLKFRQDGEWFRPQPGPRGLFDGLPLNFQEQPSLIVDAAGHLWLIFRQWLSRQSPPEVWNLYAVSFDGQNWTGPYHLPFSDGRLEQDFPAAAAGDGSVWVIYSTDFRGSGTERTRQWDVFTSRLMRTGPVFPPAQLVAEQPSPPENRYRPTPNKGYQTQVGSKNYRLFYGDLHRHTDIRGHGGTDISIPGQYRYAYNAAELDFMATTDHNLTTGDAWADGLDEYGWWRTKKNADLYFNPGRFVSLFAYERSFGTPGGHRNIVWPDRGGELITGNRSIPGENIPLQLWKRLKKTEGISIPHTIADQNQPRVSWEWHDPEQQPLVEMYQGARSSYEYAGAPAGESRGHTALEESGYFLWDALERQHRIGVIASSDHGSTHMSYAAVYAEEFTRKSIFEALKKRRTFAATDNIVLDFRIGSSFMGEEVTLDQPPTLEIRARGTGPISRIDVVKDNQFIYTLRPGQPHANFTFSDMESSPGTSYYYIRVIQEDEMMAWSSPIWVNRR